MGFHVSLGECKSISNACSGPSSVQIIHTGFFEPGASKGLVWGIQGLGLRVQDLRFRM